MAVELETREIAIEQNGNRGGASNRQSSIGNREYQVLGTRPIRHDGVDKVTGRAVYGADVKLQGMLRGKVLRSPHAHARIISIDTRAAERLPGVKAVITGKDFPKAKNETVSSGESTVNYSNLSRNVMAHDKVLYHGHPVAAVAATHLHIAEEALALITVEYELLPVVLDVREAMKPNAPILLSELRTKELGDATSDTPSNIAEHLQHSRGDVEKGFAEAHVVVEREFFTNTVHQGYIEPQNATAIWNADDTIHVWCSTQGAFAVRSETSEVLSVPISRVNVTPTEIGGGFGGKTGACLEPLCALLSKKAGGRPVQMWMQRDEVLKATYPTSASYIKVKIGADKNGIITAAQAYMAYEAGAFPGSPVGAGSGVIFAPYKLSNVLIDGYDVLVNKPKAGAYRAPGGTNAAFASETVIDELAEKLGIDPLEFRKINAAKEGDRRADGPRYKKIGFLETVEAAMAHSHYKANLKSNEGQTTNGASSSVVRHSHKKRGRGVASGFWFNWGGKSSANANVNPDGTVNFVEGSTDIGGTRTSLSMQLAESLGIRVEDVNPIVVGTDQIGYNDTTGGSRTTFGSGWAAFELGQKIKQQMRERAATLWEVKVEDVNVEGDVYLCNEKRITFKELADKLDDTGGPLTASVSVDTKNEGPAFATHIVDVEVDTDTGKVNILRYTAVQDAGKAIYPPYVEGQMQGGVAQGAGWALHEDYVYDKDGHLLNASLLDYRMMTALDLPMIDTVIVEAFNPGHPYGVRGVGEVPIVPPAAAIANAIYDAVGVRMNVLPMNPKNVLMALGKI